MIHDKDGDAHYDTISAFQKAIRGSDVDAALYYLALLMEAGELAIACRRLLITAYEDIGFGNAQATARTYAAVQAAREVGLPEARIPLSFAVIELALSPKSNTAYKAISSALQTIRQGEAGAGAFPEYDFRAVCTHRDRRTSLPAAGRCKSQGQCAGQPAADRCRHALWQQRDPTLY